MPGKEDTLLREAIFSAGNIILPAQIERREPAAPPSYTAEINRRERLVPPHPYFADVARGVGLAHTETTEVDNVARWHDPVITYTETMDNREVRRRGASLALAAYAHFRCR